MRPPLLLENIKKLQEHILETGLARAILALPAPRMLALTYSSADDSGIVSIFSRTIIEPEILAVSRDLFASGHYSLSVQEAFKAVEKFVQRKSKALRLSGTKLMEHVFSETTPKLSWTDRSTESERDEQRGYLRLYAGAMLGIRNPVTHEFGWVEDPVYALELILFAQHLLRKAKIARIENLPTATSST